MKNKLILLLLCIVPCLSFGSDKESILEAIYAIESHSGKLANVQGDNGQAHGGIQMHLCVIEHVNEYFGTNYTIDDAYNWETAQEIFWKYIEICSDVYYDYFGEAMPLEGIARCWNSGPKWFTKTHLTDDYWNRVQNLMKAMPNNSISLNWRISI